jgi:Reverse transcriptase-like
MKKDVKDNSDTKPRRTLRAKEDTPIVDIHVDASLIQKKPPYANLFLAAVVYWHKDMPPIKASVAKCGHLAMAEWEAVRFGLQKARELGISRVRMQTDCLTVADQFNKVSKFRTKNKEELTQIAQECWAFAEGMTHFELNWVPREKNKAANHTCRKAAGLKHPGR